MKKFEMQGKYSLSSTPVIVNMGLLSDIKDSKK
jgi:hypothetical protein